MRRLTLGATAALALALVAGGAVVAEHPPRPSHIHAGVCPAPGDVQAALTDVAPGDGEAVGAASAITVESSTTTVDLALADIVAADHSIVVHASPDDMGTYVVCGDIGGATRGGSGLAVGLAPVGDSTFSGIAWLGDNGDGTTSVSVFINEAPMMMDGA